MRRLLEKGVPGKLNLSVSPPLIEMLRDESLISKISGHLQRQLELAEKEVAHFKDGPEAHLARFYLDRQRALIDTWENRIGRDLLKEFKARKLQGN